jgi:hypothetical protein
MLMQPRPNAVANKPTDAKAKKRKAKQPPAVKTPAGVRELGGELRSLADQFDKCARLMERLNVPSFRISIGNFKNAKQKIVEFQTVQILNRLAVVCARRGLDFHELVAEENGSRNT